MTTGCISVTRRQDTPHVARRCPLRQPPSCLAEVVRLALPVNVQHTCLTVLFCSCESNINTGSCHTVEKGCAVMAHILCAVPIDCSEQLLTHVRTSLCYCPCNHDLSCIRLLIIHSKKRASKHYQYPQLSNARLKIVTRNYSSDTARHHT